MDSFVYQWTNLTLGKIYIGFHKGDETDGYVCSSASSVFWDDYKNPNYRWERQILHKGTMAECQLVESRLLNNLDITSEEVYNNRNNVMFNMNEEVRSKLKAAAINRGKNPEYRKAQAQGAKKAWENDPSRHERQSTKAKLQKITEETKEKIRIARSRQIITPESRIKAAESIRTAPDIVCPHCGTTGRYLGSMKKNHYDNCRTIRQQLGL
jgi:hypothetical protein